MNETNPLLKPIVDERRRKTSKTPEEIASELLNEILPCGREYLTHYISQVLLEMKEETLYECANNSYSLIPDYISDNTVEALNKIAKTCEIKAASIRQTINQKEQ